MGIPVYFAKISKHHPHIVTNKTPQCTNLFFDMNSLIHPCVNEVSSSNYDVIFENIGRTTDMIINTIKPSNITYIAVDGVAPRSKMVQQRKRRYISAYKTKLINIFKKNKGIPIIDFDTNTISPGTDFMISLHRYLVSRFDKNKVIVSGHDEPGEGEQKLTTYIQEKCNEQDVNIVYGLDADLIMLSLMLENRKMYLLRDNIYLDINVLRREISIYLYKSVDQSYMYDYIFVCFLLGNDFVPGLNFLGIKHGGLDLVCDALRKTEGHIVTGRFGINLNNLLRFLNFLVKHEANLLSEIICKYNRTNKERKSCNTLSDYMEELELYPMRNKQYISLDPKNDPKWKEHYYYEQFGNVSVRDICNNYTDGLIWNMNYYFNREFSKDWHYKYNYAPCLCDIVSYLSGLTQNDIDDKTRRLKTSERTFNEQMQLLCIMPSESIPERLRSIATDIDKGCFYMYPMSFPFTTFLKEKLYECSPILPELDLNTLETALKKM